MLAFALILGIGIVALLVMAAFLLGRGAGRSRFTGSQDVGYSPETMGFWIPANESPPPASSDDPRGPEASDFDSGANDLGGSDSGGGDFGGGDYGGDDFGGGDSGGGGSD